MDKTEQQNKDEQFMRRALVEAEAARDEGEIPVGAVIVAGDRIIARAHNLT
ncbi:MAG: deaminase, partial [Prevotella sp.]|nr:deaminase [Prevotella sp.]